MAPFHFQSFFETVFVLIALACIPVMLFAKPYFMWKAEKERQAGNGHMQLVRHCWAASAAKIGAAAAAKC